MMVQLERHSPAAVAEFRAHLCRSPHVQVCMEISGAYDIFTCIAIFKGMEEFNTFGSPTAISPAIRPCVATRQAL